MRASPFYFYSSNIDDGWSNGGATGTAWQTNGINKDYGWILVYSQSIYLGSSWAEGKVWKDFVYTDPSANNVIRVEYYLTGAMMIAAIGVAGFDVEIWVRVYDVTGGYTAAEIKDFERHKSGIAWYSTLMKLAPVISFYIFIKVTHTESFCTLV